MNLFKLRKVLLIYLRFWHSLEGPSTFIYWQYACITTTIILLSAKMKKIIFITSSCFVRNQICPDFCWKKGANLSFFQPTPSHAHLTKFPLIFYTNKFPKKFFLIYYLTILLFWLSSLCLPQRTYKTQSSWTTSLNRLGNPVKKE